MLFAIFDEKSEAFSRFERSSNLKRSIEFQKYVDTLTPCVLSPLRMLKSLFAGPLMLIDKRRHKLLDYEALLADAEIKRRNQGASLSSKEVATTQSRFNRFYFCSFFVNVS